MKYLLFLAIINYPHVLTIPVKDKPACEHLVSLVKEKGVAVDYYRCVPASEGYIPLGGAR